MKTPCEKKCGRLKMLANLKCPGCFGVEAYVDEKERCDCKLIINPDQIWGWD